MHEIRPTGHEVMAQQRPGQGIRVKYAPTGHEVKAQGNALGLKYEEPEALKGRDN